MLDEIDRLRTDEKLRQLLTHYAHLGEVDHETWQDRLTALEGVEPPEMTRLHGELLALGWIEWTSAQTKQKSSACYRVTSDGLRAFRLIDGSTVRDAQVAGTATAPARHKRPRPKRDKKPAEALVSS